MCDLKKPWAEMPRKLETFDEMLDEQKKFMDDEKYVQYKAEYYSAFAIPDIPENVVDKLISIEASKFDATLLERQLHSINKPFINQRINISPIDDALKSTSIKELEKQFRKEVILEK